MAMLYMILFLNTWLEKYRRENKMITYDKVKIYSVRTEDSYYDVKKKKHIKYAKPKVTKKLLFDDNCYDLGEFYMQLKNCHERDPYNKIEVSFNSSLEY
jgi:hypothetical protein